MSIYEDDEEYYDPDDDESYLDYDEDDDDDDDESSGSSGLGSRSPLDRYPSRSGSLPGRDRVSGPSTGGLGSGGSSPGGGSRYTSGSSAARPGSSSGSSYSGPGSRSPSGGSSYSSPSSNRPSPYSRPQSPISRDDVEKRSGSGSSFSSGSGSSSSGSGSTGRAPVRPYSSGSSSSSPSSSSSFRSPGSPGSSSSSSRPSSPSSPTPRSPGGPSSSSSSSSSTSGLRSSLLGGSSGGDKDDKGKSSSSSSSSKPRTGFGGFGNRNKDKESSSSKDDSKSSGGRSGVSGLTSRFGFGGKKDEKPGSKSDTRSSGPGSGSSSSSGGSLIGGLTSRLPGGGKKDAQSGSSGRRSDSGGKSSNAAAAALGGIVSRLPFGGGKKDDKKESRQSQSGDKSGGIGSRIPGIRRGGSSGSGSQSASAQSASSVASSGGRRSMFGQAKSSGQASSRPTGSDSKSSSSRSRGDQSSGGGILSRINPFNRIGDKSARPQRSARTSRAPKIENEGISLDTKLDILGVGLVFGSLILFFSAISTEQAAISGLLLFLGQVFGWGAVGVPIAMFAVGGWLIVRHFGENAPTIDLNHVAGIVLGYICLLVLFTYLDSFNYASDFSGLRLNLQIRYEVYQAGGGLIGAEIYYFFVTTVTEIGGFLLMVLGFIISAMFITRLSASELTMFIVGVWSGFRRSLARSAEKRRAAALLKAQQTQAQADISVSKPAPAELSPGTASAALPEPDSIPIQQRDILIRRGGQEVSGNREPAMATAEAGVQSAPAQSDGSDGKSSGGGLFGFLRRGNNNGDSKKQEKEQSSDPGTATKVLGGGLLAAGGLLGALRGGSGNDEEASPSTQPSTTPQPATASAAPLTQPQSPGVSPMSPIPSQQPQTGPQQIGGIRPSSPPGQQPAAASSMGTQSPSPYARPATPQTSTGGGTTRLSDLLGRTEQSPASPGTSQPSSPAGASGPTQTPMSPTGPASQPQPGTQRPMASPGASSVPPVRPTMPGQQSPPSPAGGSSPTGDSQTPGSQRPAAAASTGGQQTSVSDFMSRIRSGTQAAPTPSQPSGTPSPFNKPDGQSGDEEQSTASAQSAPGGIVDPMKARQDRLNALRGGQTAASPSQQPAAQSPHTPATEPHTPQSAVPKPAEQTQSPLPAAEKPPEVEPLPPRPERPGSSFIRPSAGTRPEDAMMIHSGSSAPRTPAPQQPPAAQTPSQPAATSGTAQPPAGTNGHTQPPAQQPSVPVINVTGQPPQQPQVQASRKQPNWRLPDYRTLFSAGSEQEFDRARLLQLAHVIEETLQSFGAPGRVVEVNTGPVITQFGVEPDYLTARSGKKHRVKVSAIAQLDKDLQLALGAKSIRIEAPVPGKGYVGIEVPNEKPSLVSLRDVMESDEFQRIKSPLSIGLGQSVDGSPIAADLTSMPHLLIAGTTGSGKSVCVNSVICSLIAKNTPDIVKFIMVDPKRVELTGYNGIPHLVAPVVVELERIVGVLKWVTREMDERYKQFSNAGARNIEDFNKHRSESTPRMPYIIVIIDELADLMMLAPEETERTITRIAALARATGIHLVIATQRPSVDVVTGLIKANFPARIAFAVAGGVDSRVILDQPGAERLLGRGDMLYMSGDSPAPLRLQGVFVSDMEINNINRYWKRQSLENPDLMAGATITAESAPLTAATAVESQPSHSVLPRGERVKQQAFWDTLSEESEDDDYSDGDDEQEDELYEKAVAMVRQLNKASVSLLQRRLRIGYTRAARLIDVMEERGVVGPPTEGSKPRAVLPMR